MKDQILAEIGFISDEMLEEISGYTPKTRESHRKHHRLPYIMFGKEYIYPIAVLKEEPAVRGE